MRILSYFAEYQLLKVIPPNSAFGARDAAMIRFDLETGLRVSELAGLQVRHVCGAKPEGQSGRRVRTQLHLPAWLAKGGRERIIPLGFEARQAVVEILRFNHARGFSTRPDAPLFPNREHRPMSPRAIQRMVEGYRQKAELDVKVTPHTFRHTMATRMIEEGSNTHLVKRALGHSRLSSTERYLHSSPEKLAEAMEKTSRAKWVNTVKSLVKSWAGRSHTWRVS